MKIECLYGSEEFWVSTIFVLTTHAHAVPPSAGLFGVFLVFSWCFFQGKLRIGMAESTVQVALAHAVTYTPPRIVPEGESKDAAWEAPPVLDASKTMKSEKFSKLLQAADDELKRCFSEKPSYNELIPALCEVGIDGLHDRCHLTPGFPVFPMLAKPTKGISEVLDRFEGIQFTCEWKYDGERLQVCPGWMPTKMQEIKLEPETRISRVVMLTTDHYLHTETCEILEFSHRNIHNNSH
jgi:hypothetical protein